MYPNFTGYQGVLPPQQILQANGKASIDALRMSPNSSVLIADQTQPIIWRCVSDSLGNVSSSAFDISPHKDEILTEREALTNTLNEINDRLKRLENRYEPSTKRANEPTNIPVETNVQKGTRNEQSTGIPSASNFSKPKG